MPVRRAVQHFVYSSVGSAERKTGIPHFDDKWRVENEVRALGFSSYVILRPVFFMENLPSPWFLNGDTLGTAMKASTKLQVVAVDDIGRIGARAFTDAAKRVGYGANIAALDDEFGPMTRAENWAAQTLGGSEQTRAATALLRRYEAALNRGDVAGIPSLYAPDAVFMAQHRSPAVGQPEIETAYREIFGTIRLDIRFQIDEVVVVSPTVAYARTRSSGTTTILANGAQVSEGNQELFVLTRPEQSGEWRIGRYIFSTTQPRAMKRGDLINVVAPTRSSSKRFRFEGGFVAVHRRAEVSSRAA